MRYGKVIQFAGDLLSLRRAGRSQHGMRLPQEVMRAGPVAGAGRIGR